jgi:hypothetical protein
MDGLTIAVDEHVLIKDEGTGANNGIYVLTDAGGAGDPWILTRRDDFDSDAEVTASAIVPVSEGTLNGDKAFYITTNDDILINVTSLSFSIFTEGAMGSLPPAVFDPAADSLPFVDADDGNNAKLDAWPDIAALIAGTGMTATAGVLDVTIGTWYAGEVVTTEVIAGTDTVMTDTLDNVPSGPILLVFNGVVQLAGAGEDYTISGQTITWLANTGTAANMTAADDVRAYYGTTGVAQGSVAALNTEEVVLSGTDKSRGTTYTTVIGNRGTPVTGNWYDWNGTFAGGDLQDFTEAGGVLTYTGSQTKVFKVSCQFYMRGGGTNGTGNKVMGISVNSATPAAYNQAPIRLSATASTGSIDGIVTMSTGDTVNPQILAVAGADGTTTAYWDLINKMTISE